jgi:dolichyl-phosphate-mannose-protein mannosyltransferase
MKKWGLPILILVALVLRIWMSVQIYSGDVNNHIGWAESILEKGSRGAYSREYIGIMPPTYPPLALYGFVTSSWLHNLIERTIWSLNLNVPAFPSSLVWLFEDQDVLPAFYKIPAIFADLGLGILIYKFARQDRHLSHSVSLLASAAFLLNPAVWYLSSLWGQIESFTLFFFIASLWLVFKKRPLLASLAFMASLLSKQSSLLFAPLFAVYFYSRFGWKTTIKSALIQLVFFYLAYLPFATGFSPLWPFSIYYDRLQTGSGSNYITDHAMNPWIYYTRLQKIPDTGQFLAGLTFNRVGSLVFAVFAGLSVLPLFIKRLTPQLLVRSALLLNLSAFLFMTRMHERYLAPSLVLLLLASLKNKWLFPVYLVVSAVHLAGLYHNWWFPHIPDLKLFVNNWSFVSALVPLTVVAFVLCLLETYRHEDA